MQTEKRLTILKIGGSVITDRTSEVPNINHANLSRLATEIAEGMKSENFQLVMVHGVGSYGHQIVKRTGIDKGISNDEQKLGMAQTQMQVSELNVLVCKQLQEAGIPAMPCQASAAAVMNNGRVSEWDVSAVREMLSRGVVPVLYGVPAVDKSMGCSILSGDQIAPYLAKHLKADRIIHGTDVDGIFTGDPKKDKNAKHIPLINAENIEQVKTMLGGSTNVDVSGGMTGKVAEIAGTGIRTMIVSATVPGRIRAALLGENIGTLIRI
ncbi:MAG: isopentenyl phosphate kinase [Candidatus Aenigmatarchaeota archaeon]